MFVEKIEITGDINASPSQLVYRSLKNKMSDYYVIQDMNENTLNNTLTIIVSLYRQPSLDMRFSV
ncbi:hypothetical protein [Photobacterium aquae]|nr:hypothetical protein [Photobacterium aquae]